MLQWAFSLTFCFHLPFLGLPVLTPFIIHWLTSDASGWVFPSLVLSDTYPTCFLTIPVLATADNLDQVCSVNQKVKDTFSDEGRAVKDTVNWYLPGSDWLNNRPALGDTFPGLSWCLLRFRQWLLYLETHSLYHIISYVSKLKPLRSKVQALKAWVYWLPSAPLVTSPNRSTIWQVKQTDSVTIYSLQKC